MAALERYDGVNYRVVRKARRENRWPRGLDLLILSARYGLLGADAPIDDYDMAMTPARARELRADVVGQLAGRVSAGGYGEIFVNLGRSYLLALEGWERDLPEAIRVSYAMGGIGQRASQMLCWIRQIEERQRWTTGSSS
jgi:hypothetical protein